jgi:hypothetical protein
MHAAQCRPARLEFRILQRAAFTTVNSTGRVTALQNPGLEEKLACFGMHLAVPQANFARRLLEEKKGIL